MLARLLALPLGAMLLGLPVAAQPAAGTKIDYASPASWVCRPGRPADACGRSDQDSTVLQADGSASIERFHSDPDAPIDCFYVYPTVSLDPGGNANPKVEAQEVRVVDQQFARFASVCRPYAPVYRQVTLTALRAALTGHPVNPDRALAYNDVKQAWNYYLAHDNHGRGVVLIGHSQGSLVLAELVRKEVDGKSVQKRLLSVILAGYSLQVPVGKDVGGDFTSISLCRSASQIGCAINFASFRAESPPPPDERLFGISRAPGLEAACVNPAALDRSAGSLHAYLASGTQAQVADGVQPGFWTTPPKPISTPFVEVPGLLSAECSHDGGFHYLAVTLHPTPGGARTNAITGDVVVRGRTLKDWGLHLIDMNLTIGNLVDIVRQEGQTYLAEQR